VCFVIQFWSYAETLLDLVVASVLPTTSGVATICITILSLDHTDPWIFGSYADSQCIEEYTGNLTTVESVVYAADNGDAAAYDLEEELQTWNDAFHVFKTCLPCKAVNSIDIVAGSNAEKSGNATKQYGFYDNDNNDDQDNNATNNDNDGYAADVNECMKVKTTTNMYSASINNVILAENQGSVTAAQIGIASYGPESERSAKLRNQVAWVFLGCSVCLSTLTQSSSAHYLCRRSAFPS
jgi:hypothetical protein